MSNVNSAWYFPETGTPDVLSETHLAMPIAGEGELLLKVLASGFNPIDTKIRAGLAPIAADNQVPGCDVCGEVISVGQNVSGFVPGDRVYGCAGGVKGSSGTLCRFMVVDAELMAPAPKSISAEQAAVLPLVSITAFEALERLHVAAGESCLIMGGSGGVGQMAVQLAKLRGAVVTATAGNDTRKDQIASFDATAIGHHEVASKAGMFDKVLDTHGGESLQAGLMAAGPGAQVATINARNTYDLTQAHAKGLTLHAVFMLLPLLTGKGRINHGRFLHWLAKEVDGQRIAVPETETQPASAVASVHRRYEAGDLKTKVAFTL
ncbi:alcohol dehydrogenase catalytic domain-containing protein [Thalassolituus maritimus]|uniref:Zinc-dependent alcohol dehydrogenase family protein n=1 Tax=Thalassolituus maritimus TaxID=484498 RepID=A0ABQ0A2G1_9GAMM